MQMSCHVTGLVKPLLSQEGHMPSQQTRPAWSSRTLPAYALWLPPCPNPSQVQPAAASLLLLKRLQAAPAWLQQMRQLRRAGQVSRAAVLGRPDPLAPPLSSCRSPRMAPTCPIGLGRMFPSFGCLCLSVSFTLSGFSCFEQLSFTWDVSNLQEWAH